MEWLLAAASLMQQEMKRSREKIEAKIFNICS
jgi:hypothetical protein